MATQIGFVKAIIGEVTATGADGTIRTLKVGDQVFANELISTGPGGAVEIEFADGSVMDLGRNSQALLDSAVFDPSAPIETETAEGVVPDDIAAIQQALLEGEDPTQIGEATAAGAGVEGGNEGHEPVFVDYLNPAIIPDAGFDTIGVTNDYDLPEEDIIILEEEEAPLPTVGVSVEVEIEIDPQNPPPDDGIPNEDYPLLVEGNGAIVLEGTNGGEPREVTFLLKLSAISDQDVEVTYELRPLSADTPDDWFNGDLIQTVTIPAGTQVVPVTVMIVQDHLDEGNEQFDIVLLSATNATINPESNSAIVTIYDDDTTPVAQDDFNSVTEDEGEGTPFTQGNVISGANDAGNDPLSQEDTDEDGDMLFIQSFSDNDDETDAEPGELITGQYGTLTMDALGNYTYTLTSNDDPVIQGLKEGEPLYDTFSYVVTDTYNQPQAATLTITILGTNDAPNLVVNNGDTGVVYEAGLADGSMIGMTLITTAGEFTLTDPDGLDDITHVKITVDGSDYVIPIADLGDDNVITGTKGLLVITSYDSETGVATFEYTLTDNADEGVDDVDSFSLSVSDDNQLNYSTPASINITIVDDIPAFTVVNDGQDVGDAVSFTAYNSTTLHDGIQLADWVYGADGFANVTVTIPDGVNAEVVSQSAETIVLNFYEGESEDPVATLTLNADGTDSLQTYYREFETETIPLLTSAATAGGPGVYFINTPSLVVTVTADDGDGVPEPNSDDQVNPSKQGWAVDNNIIEEGESITFSFDSAVNNFSFRANGFTGGASNVGLIVTVVYADMSSEIFNLTTDGTQLIHVDELPGFGNGDVTDILSVTVESDASVQDANDGFRLNDVSVTTTSSTPPVDLAYEGIVIEIEDGDNDTASQTINFYLDGDEGTNLEVEAVAGTSGNDILVGTDGDDVIISGSGDDTLTGNEGADEFVWIGGESGTDQVLDFNAADGDVLNLADLLDPTGSLDIGGADELDDYLKASYDDIEDKTTIEVFTNGDANDGGSAIQTIIVNGDVSDLASLIATNNLNVDQS